MPDAGLTSEAVAVARLTKAIRDRLYAIYETAYEDTTRARFEKDLDEKDWALLLRAPDGQLAGFSTQKVFAITHQNRRLRILFSGDTIIDPQWWGTQELVRAWCRFAGTMKGEEPETPLYWFLISKGHRTYMYLPLFFRRFQPSCDDPPTPFERDLMNHLGTSRFGDRYDARTGLIDASAPLDRLNARIDSTPDRLHNRHVAYFAACNPRYADGVELVCLTEIAPENMRSFARRELERGMEVCDAAVARRA